MTNKKMSAVGALAMMMMAAPAFAGGSSSAGAEAGTTFKTVPASNQFGFSLARELTQAELKKTANANTLFSPASAAMAFQMLLNGAGGETRTELASVLNLSTTTLDDVNASAESLLSYFVDLSKQTSHQEVEPGSPLPTPLTLTMANSAWANSSDGFKFNPKFTQALDRSYQAQTESADFASPTGLNAINNWASQHTQGKITNIIDQQTLQALSFVLMNATYFKANWAEQFPTYRTSDASFTRGDGTTSSVKMMANTIEGYTKVGDTEVMEIPYADGSSSMYVVLPAQSRALGSVIADANGPLSENFWTQVSQQPVQRAQFSMPKFGFKSDLPLNDALKTLGLKKVFSADADLSGISSAKTYVSLAKQDTFIKVDETGTEAAAVTVVAGAGAAMPPQHPIVMTVNRPFLISIVEKKSGAVLFLGAVANPTVQ